MIACLTKQLPDLISNYLLPTSQWHIGVYVAAEGQKDIGHHWLDPSNGVRWPLTSDPSARASHGPLLTLTENQLTLCHVDPEEKVKTGPGSASVTMSAPAVSQCGCQGAGSECDDYLTDRKPFCLRGYLAACRGDDVSAGGQKGHFTVQLLLVSWRCSRNQIQTYPKWHSPPSLRRIIMSCFCDVLPAVHSSHGRIKVLLTWNW